RPLCRRTALPQSGPDPLVNPGPRIGNLALGAHATQEREVGQSAMAEAVDRVDWRALEGKECPLEPLRLVGAERYPGADSLARLTAKRLLDGRADACAQFAGGLFREGHSQDLVEPHVRVEQYLDHQVLDGEGFAGASTCLDDAMTVEWDPVDDFRTPVAAFHQASSKIVSTRPKRRWIIAATSGSSGGS